MRYGFWTMCSGVLMASAVSAADLTVTVAGLPSDDGTVRAAVYNSATGFKGQTDQVASVIIGPHDKMVRFTIANLPAGTYAVAVFHDVNGNGKLDTNLVGMPTEPWGFSNDASGNFGPPDFSDAGVDVPVTGKAVTITLHS